MSTTQDGQICKNGSHGGLPISLSSNLPSSFKQSHTQALESFQQRAHAQKGIYSIRYAKVLAQLLWGLVSDATYSLGAVVASNFRKVVTLAAVRRTIEARSAPRLQA